MELRISLNPFNPNANPLSTVAFQHRILASGTNVAPGVGAAGPLADLLGIVS